MSLTAIKQPLDQVHTNLPLPTDAHSVDTGHDGHRAWLAWLQKLLCANALALYSVPLQKPDGTLELAALWPENHTLLPSAMGIALRAAKTCSPVRASQEGSTSESIVCVPGSSGEGDHCVQHVLLIERIEPSKLPLPTQLRLVMWAFETLTRYCHDAGFESSQDKQTSQPHLDAANQSSASFAQCAEQLARLSQSQRCLIARLSVKRDRECVGSAYLMAVSGQPRVDNRLAISRQLVMDIDKAFSGKTLISKPVLEHDTALSSITRPTTSNDEALGLRWMLPVQLAEQWLVVSLERHGTRALSDAELSEIESAARALLGMALLADPQTLGLRSAIQRGARRLRTKATQQLSRFAVLLTIGIALLAFLLFPVEHRVNAPLSIEAAEQHVLIAPVDGFVQSVAVSAGDRVHEGQILAELDDQELALSEQKLHSEAMQNQQEYTRVLAAHDRVEMTRLKEEGALINTEILRLNLQREKMALRAPVDAVVLSGSWQDFLGAAVSAGDTLFSLGSDNSHRLVLDVSEYDVRHIKPDQSVAIRLAAEPSTVLAGRVTAIMPLAVAKAGSNSVQVHATLDQDVLLRPGMQGIGKVLIGSKSRLMQWSERASARFIWLGWKLGFLR